MPSVSNHVVIAAAGSRKTQYIVDKVLSDSSRRVLVTTYTNENLRQITQRLCIGSGILPAHVTVMGWFTFLLNECARPYQSSVLSGTGVIRGLNFVGKKSFYAGKENPRNYYLDAHADIYRDAASCFAIEANSLSRGKVIDRLSRIYDHIYIDEVQDMAGYDLDLLDCLMESRIGLTMVGDPRQATFATNNSRKNKRFKGSAISSWLKERQQNGQCEIEERTQSWRCNQAICDFADGLYPDLPVTVSLNHETTGHDGVFDIRPSDVQAYVERYAPVILRPQKNTDTQGLAAMNIGISKGSTFDRVLIFPTKPMAHYYHNLDSEKAGDLSKLYVAVTRAKYSVTFVIP